jgi:threonyl-tRNA synthetase
LPIAEAHHEYAAKVNDALKHAGMRTELSLSKDGLGKKVRAAKEMKTPYWLVIGDKDIEANMVTLESRDHGQIGQLSLDDILSRLEVEINNKK